jgi:hypothetical protein
MTGARSARARTRGQNPLVLENKISFSLTVVCASSFRPTVHSVLYPRQKCSEFYVVKACNRTVTISCDMFNKILMSVPSCIIVKGT